MSLLSSYLPFLHASFFYFFTFARRMLAGIIGVWVWYLFIVQIVLICLSLGSGCISK